MKKILIILTISLVIFGCNNHKKVDGVYRYNITCEEYYLTLAHELNEPHLMAKFGWKYITAHDSSLSLEQTIRHSNEEICLAHEAKLKKVSATDYSNICL